MAGLTGTVVTKISQKSYFLANTELSLVYLETERGIRDCLLLLSFESPVEDISFPSVEPGA